MLWLLKGIANAMAVRNCQLPLQGIANHYCKALPITEPGFHKESGVSVFERAY